VHAFENVPKIGNKDSNIQINKKLRLEFIIVQLKVSLKLDIDSNIGDRSNI
jgi:hypothetical protein